MTKFGVIQDDIAGLIAAIQQAYDQAVIDGEKWEAHLLERAYRAVMLTQSNITEIDSVINEPKGETVQRIKGTLRMGPDGVYRT